LISLLQNNLRPRGPRSAINRWPGWSTTLESLVAGHWSSCRLTICVEVNVIGQLAVTQALLDALRAGRGRIVNVGSISGRLATPITGPYVVSKFALEGMTDVPRRELLSQGIQRLGQDLIWLKRS
jgi:short chain dehydrogenase